ncbi:MAG: ATP-binding protein [Myxococcota bacterium]|nr:ATP-binding protein [Myxococcota bacterium]
MLFDPPPNNNCPICSGEGYAISSKGEYAFATQCECVPQCVRCNGTGIVSVVKDGARRTGRCRCQKLPDRIQLFNYAKLPVLQGHNSFQNFRHINKGATLAVKSCNSWIREFNAKKASKGLVLSGEVGRGKTHLLIAIVKTLIFEFGVRARFIEFSRLLSILRDGYSRGESNSELLSQLATVPILAIDELGKGRLTDWELSIIDEVVSRRYNAMGIILGTTNYSWEPPTGKGVANLSEDFSSQTLGDRVGPRVFSRLQEICYFAPVQGQDFRALRPQRMN